MLRSRRTPESLHCANISWGAAPSSDTILRAMADTFPDAFNVAVFGQTEMSPITCVLDGEDAIRKLGSVGRVIPTIQARVVDDEMNDVAPGEVGEIVYRGPTMMRDYWNNPTATAEAFDGGWFHSGDLVRVDDEGFVYVVDRKKDMIISGGENIYCAEVENVLFGHPAIVEVAVIGRPDDEVGRGPGRGRRTEAGQRRSHPRGAAALLRRTPRALQAPEGNRGRGCTAAQRQRQGRQG